MSAALERVDPRIERTRARVYTATLDLIAENGLPGAAVDAIAERCGMSRSTIYRRWPALPRLYYEAFAQMARRVTPRPLGDASTELLHYLEDYAHRLNDPYYCAVMFALLEASRREPELEQARQDIFREGASRIAGILRTALAAGTVRADLDVHEAIEIVLAPFMYRRAFDLRDIEQVDVERLHARIVTEFHARDR